MMQDVLPPGIPLAVTGMAIVAIALALIGIALNRSMRSRVDLVQRLETANQELKRALVVAQEASDAKSSFLATMSHELRTPLNAFSGYLQLMEMEVAGPVTDEQKGYLARMQASSRHLTGLINDVLDLAKIESGQLVVRDAPASLEAVVDAAVSIMRPQAEGAGLRLSARAPTDRGITYVGDEDRVRQILVNLISNAVKYNTPGGDIDIEWGEADTAAPDARRLEGRGPWAYVRVGDTGIGIAPDRLETIFEPFTQLDTGHARRVGGTGLGLTISRQLARQMGGDLTVRSVPGEGSAFTHWLRASHEGAAAPRDPVVEISSRTGTESVAGFATVGEAVARHSPRILRAFEARLRGDPTFVGAPGMHRSQLADHHLSLLGDIAAALIALEELGGAPSMHLVESTEIQRFIAELHGIQRSRMGWSEEVVRSEHAILREEVSRALERSGDQGRAATGTAARVARNFIELAEEVSVKALRGARDRERVGGGDTPAAGGDAPD